MDEKTEPLEHTCAICSCERGGAEECECFTWLTCPACLAEVDGQPVGAVVEVQRELAETAETLKHTCAVRSLCEGDGGAEECECCNAEWDCDACAGMGREEWETCPACLAEVDSQPVKTVAEAQRRLVAAARHLDKTFLALYHGRDDDNTRARLEYHEEAVYRVIDALRVLDALTEG